MICLDSGNWDRIGKVSLLKNKNTKVINIDHHISNTQFGDYNYVDYISSTSEIIFNFIQDRKYEINLPIAYSIYTGLVNDTGNFKHSNTTKEVFEIAAQLVGYGVQPNEVIKNFFDTKSMGRIKLIGETLSNFKLVDSLNLVYYYISEQKLEKLGALSEDTSGLGEMLLSYEKASVSLILRESDGMIKGSFRSKNEVDVNRLASFFNGGGHIKAAGFKTDKSVEEILETIKKELNN
jgi:phosphoesterase RecJ-like protein